MSLFKILSEGVYYHGTTLHRDNPDIDAFKITAGQRSNPLVGLTREVYSPWVFFTDDEDVAEMYGSAKTDGIYHSRGDFSHKTVVLKYRINESRLNILDLTTEDYEFKLQNIGIDPIKWFGMGMYEQDQMWELLDDNEMSDKIIQSGYNAVKLIESDVSYSAESLAIHINIVNKVTTKLS